MAFTNCNNCGAQIDDRAKFCRQCGQPVSRIDAGPRGYVSPTDYEAPTRPMSPAPTAPSYYPGQNLSPMPVPSTNNLERGTRTWKVLGIVALVLVLLFGFMVFLTRSVFEPTREQQTASAPERPGVPPPVPPTIPAPPPAPPAGGGSNAARVAVPIYPGAKQVMEIVGSEEGNVMQLDTSDSAAEVADWYAAQINPTKRLTLPGGVRVLQAQGVTVLITPGEEDLTRIIIKQGLDF